MILQIEPSTLCLVHRTPYRTFTDLIWVKICLFIRLHVDRELPLFGHELGQVMRESVSVVQPPSDITGQDFGTGRKLGDGAIEQLLPAVQCLQKLSLLLVNHVLDRFRIFAHFREESTKKLYDGVNLRYETDPLVKEI